MNRVFYFDVETSGTNASKHSIIQIAYQLEHSGNVVVSESTLVTPFPGAEIDPKALEVSGITMAELVGAPSYQDVYRELSILFDKYVDKFDKRDKLTVCGYNVSFDIGFLRALWEKNGDKYLGSYLRLGAPIDPRYIVPFYQHLGLIKPTSDNKLSTVAEAMGIDAGGAHDALEDVRMTKAILHKLSVLTAKEVPA